MKNKLKSVAFFQGQSTADGEASNKVSRKGMGMQRKVMGKIQGDQPVDPDVMSNASQGSHFRPELKASPLWSCKQLKAIQPPTITAVSGLFQEGMGADAPASMRASASVPRLNVAGGRRQLSRQRDGSINDGSMKGILANEYNNEEQGQRAIEFGTERIGRNKRRVDLTTLPNYL